MNAVLCRTPKNEVPSTEMQTNCRHWTLELIESHPRKLIVVVGAIAKAQIVLHGWKKLKWGVPQQLKSGRVILPILHYSAWKHQPASIVNDYRETFWATIEALSIPYFLD